MTTSKSLSGLGTSKYNPAVERFEALDRALNEVEKLKSAVAAMSANLRDPSVAAAVSNTLSAVNGRRGNDVISDDDKFFN